MLPIAIPNAVALDLHPNELETGGQVATKKRPYIGTTTAAKLLGVTRQGMLHIFKSGELKSAYQVDEGGAWIVLKSEVEELASQRERDLSNGK